MARSDRKGPTANAAHEIVRRLSDDMARKLATVRALWFAVQNQPHKSVKDLAEEYYHAVGEVLEGVPLDQIELREIERKRVLPFIKES